MRLIIAGDLVPTSSNIHLFNDGDVETLIGKELKSIWDNIDYKIFNLEVPLIDDTNPIDKHGPNLIAPTSTIAGIKKLNPSLVTLANNHILDQGKQGVISTMECLNNNEIPFIGAGINLNEAKSPYIFYDGRVKVGIYSCTENEFSVASVSQAGSNLFDPLESLDHISDLKSECDYVIVLYHGGKEHYRYPSPYLQKVCRKIVEKGADLVVCQHSHCVGAYENYKNSTIVYGQGNFIFNKYDNEYWNNGLLLKLDFSVGIDISYIPIIKTGVGVRLADDYESNGILSSFHKRSSEILNDEFLEKNYRDFAERNIELYLRSLTGANKWITRIDRYLLNGYLLKRKCSKEFLLKTQNYIECEAHRELVVEGLKIYRRGK